MVSFTCNVCQDVVRKNRIDKHCSAGKCAVAWYFTCIDCNKTFEGFDYHEHVSCISEEDKYFGRFAKSRKTKAGPGPTTKTERDVANCCAEVAASNTADLLVKPQLTERVLTDNVSTDSLGKSPIHDRTTDSVPVSCTESSAPLSDLGSPGLRPKNVMHLYATNKAPYRQNLDEHNIDWTKLIIDTLSSQPNTAVTWKQVVKRVVKRALEEVTSAGRDLTSSKDTKKILSKRCKKEALLPARFLTDIESPLQYKVESSQLT